MYPNTSLAGGQGVRFHYDNDAQFSSDSSRGLDIEVAITRGRRVMRYTSDNAIKIIVSSPKPSAPPFGRLGKLQM